MDWKDEAVGHFMQKYGIAFEHKAYPSDFQEPKNATVSFLSLESAA